MSCNCKAMTFSGEGFCYQCMPDEFSWLLPVDSVPDPFFMDRNHAYITPDNTVYVLSNDRMEAVPIGGSKNIDLSLYALKGDVEEGLQDLVNKLNQVNTKITQVENSVPKYTGGENVEVTDTHVINVDFSGIEERLEFLENLDSAVYTAGEGITIGRDLSISAEVTLDKMNQAITKAVTDTELNLESANLTVDGDNLKWRGVLNDGRELVSTIPLSSLGNNNEQVALLERRVTQLENSPDEDSQALSFNPDTRVLSISKGNNVTIPDKDTTYTTGNGLTLNGTQLAVNPTSDLVFTEGKLGIKPSYVQDNIYINGTTLVEEKHDSTKVQLDFTKLIQYINLGDLDTFSKKQYVIPDNLYLPYESNEHSNLFHVAPSPRSNKLVNAYLVVTIPEFESGGVYKTKAGSLYNNGPYMHEPSISGQVNFQIHLFNNNTNGRFFSETVRIPNKDIELTFSGYLAVGSETLRLSNLEFCITTGKLINKVEHAYVPFINSYINYTRNVDAFNYTFRTTHVPKIEFWGLNIDK